MRALLQRVRRAAVQVGGEEIASIGPGLLVLLGIGQRDGQSTAEELARRVCEIRIFDDEAGRTNRSLLEIGGEMLVVSQFTLYADTRRGRRPGFTAAAEPERAAMLVERFAATVEGHGVEVGRGRFGARMAVELVNEGPFTIWLDTDERGTRPDGT
jgi:D-tyrosyl-tRNA(Tyr) deacylase